MSGPFDGWPMRGLDAVFTAGRALLPSLPTTPATVLETAVRMTAQSLRGKRVTMRTQDQDVALTVVDFECVSHSIRLAQGRIDEVRFEAADVAWPALGLARIAVTGRGLRFAGPFSTAVKAESVHVEVDIAAETLRAELAAVRPDLRIRFDTRLFVARRPLPGELEVVPEVDDGVATLRPTALWLAGRRLALPTALKPFVIPLPNLPRGLRLTSMTTSADGVRLHGEAHHWRDRLSGTPLTDLVGLLATAAHTLTFGR
jgi:hypothetical protein